MLRHFFNDFMTFVPLQLPQLLDVTTMEEAQFYGDYALLTFPLRDPYDLEEVMDLFEDDMELITLYHHIPTHADKFGHSTCAYSNPATQRTDRGQFGVDKRNQPFRTHF